ncbi:MAG: hypothetical protein LBE12_19800 [Planctomycetaceae bacterium]|jgi:hypothetical protein|nr:hypothetical protein [Planctomycetaceae bacterium]
MKQKSFFPLSILSQNIIVAIILIVSALGLRFYKLGEWSFDLDEIATQIETRSLFENQPLPESIKDLPYHHPDPEKSQFYRLPRLIFVAHFVHWLDYRLCGDDEFGSRVFMAIMGSFSVGIAFLLGRSLFGFSTSLILAFLILLLPEHVYQSQNGRFYSQAFLFVEIVFLLGGHVAMKQSVVAAWGLVPVSLIMILSHSLSGIVWGILLGGLLFDFFFSKQSNINQSNLETKTNLFLLKIPYRIILILGIWSIVLLLIFWFHIVPLTKSWNNYDVTWRLSPVDSVLTFASDFGRSYIILCVPAWFFVLLHVRKTGWGYWLFCALTCGSAIFLLPLKMVFYSTYAFTLSFPFLVILALFINHIGQLLTQSNRRYGWLCGVVWCCFMVLLNITELNNYYKDGNRYDIRSACQYIKQYWQPNDQLFCTGLNEIINTYIPIDGVPTRLPSKDMNEYLQHHFDKIRKDKEKSNHSRFWIIMKREHYFLLDKKTRDWIDKHCQYEGSFGKFHYGHPMFLEVFLCSPQSPVPLSDSVTTINSEQ